VAAASYYPIFCFPFGGGKYLNRGLEKKNILFAILVKKKFFGK
jgi:hypothetical protein